MALPRRLPVLLLPVLLLAACAPADTAAVPANEAAGLVSACDRDGVATSFTSTWIPAAARFEIAAVEIAGLAGACDGEDLAVTLALAGDRVIKQIYPAARLEGRGDARRAAFDLRAEHVLPADLASITVTAGPAAPAPAASAAAD